MVWSKKTLKSPIVSSTPCNPKSPMYLWLSVRAYVYSNQVARGVSRASVSQSTLRNPEKPSVSVKPVKPVHEPIWRFFLFRSTCLSAYLYANFLLCNYIKLATVLKNTFFEKNSENFSVKTTCFWRFDFGFAIPKGIKPFWFKKVTWPCISLRRRWTLQ